MLEPIERFLARNKPISLCERPVIYLTKNVIEATANYVSSYGPSTEMHEGIVYWAGVPNDKAWLITTAIAPAAKTTSGSYHTSVSTNAYVIKTINELRLQLLAQVHGHPKSWVDHSEGDINGAFMPYEGFLSVVVPWYGKKGLLPLKKCGIHRYEKGDFVRLTLEEIDRIFFIVPNSIDLRRPIWEKF